MPENYSPVAFAVPISQTNPPPLPPPRRTSSTLSLPLPPPLPPQSIRRAGLRCLRRGIDDSGAIANTVDGTYCVKVFHECCWRLFFTQAAIDFLLGNMGEVVFVEFEAEMVSQDPGTFGREEELEIKIAVDAYVSGGIVVDEGEIVVAGWVLTEGSRRKQEVVILVTKDEDAHGSSGGIYKCEYEWTVEKVRAFEKVPFEDIGDAFWGTFRTEKLTSSQRDPSRNVGFVLSFTPREGRVGSRAVADYESGSNGKWMFKLLPLETYKDGTGAANEREMCERMMGIIREVAREAGWGLAGIMVGEMGRVLLFWVFAGLRFLLFE
ncbi:hypothetical protein RUND412_002802 [Rhizina undulata]